MESPWTQRLKNIVDSDTPSKEDADIGNHDGKLKKRLDFSEDEEDDYIMSGNTLREKDTNDDRNKIEAILRKSDKKIYRYSDSTDTDELSLPFERKKKNRDDKKYSFIASLSGGLIFLYVFLLTIKILQIKFL